MTEESMRCRCQGALLLLVIVAAFSLAQLPQAAFAGLKGYSTLVVSDTPNRKLQKGLVRVTYLGTNGYRFEYNGHALLVDPYFSRISFERMTLGWPVRPELGRIREGMARLSPNVDAILVTHGHVDHLLDAPVLMGQTQARLIAAPTSVELAVRAGADRARCQSVVSGNVRRLGPWKITVLPATHDTVFLVGVPFNGELGNGPPRRAGDWVCGEPLAYLVEANGVSIYIDSGGTLNSLPPPIMQGVDLAILGVALPDSRARFTAAVRNLRPRYVLPSHQDNFFRSLDLGFQFGPLTDFPFVRREFDRRHLPGHLVLLDYFQPWTIPGK